MPPNGTAGFARSRVSGSNRWPLPPARITAATLFRSILFPRVWSIRPRLIDLHSFHVRERRESPAQLVDVVIFRTARRDRHLHFLVDDVALDVDLADRASGLPKNILQPADQGRRF